MNKYVSITHVLTACVRQYGTKILCLCRTYERKVPDIRYNKLEYKPLNKLGVRLMKLYDIPPEQCPNISTRQSLRALRYLLYKKYVEVHIVKKLVW